MVLQSLGGSTVFDDDRGSTEYMSITWFLQYHGCPSDFEDDDDYEPITSLSLSLNPGYPKQPEPVFVVSPNGTFHLVDCQSHQVLMSFETGKPTYAQHHSEDSKYYLYYGTDNTLCFFKTKSSWFDNDCINIVPCDVEEFIRKKPEKYLDGGRLASKIKTTEYLVDCQTCKIIDTFCSDEVQSYQQKSAPVERDQLISVKRIDYELAFYSSTTRKRLWYLRFAHFDAWYETACNWTPRMSEHMPYVKPYIKVYQARYRGSLTNIFEANDINISSETRRLLIKDEDDTQAIQGTSKNKKKKKARKAKKDSTTTNTDEKMIIKSDETDNLQIYESQIPELLVTMKENGTEGSNIHMSSEKRLVLDIDEDDTKVIEPSKRNNKKAKRGSTTVDNVHINGYQTPELLVSKKEIGEERNNTNVFEVNGDKDVEAEVQNLEVPVLNHSLVGSHFVKYSPDLAYLVSKRCVRSLHDLMSLVNNGPQQTTEVLKAMELLNRNNWVKLTRDIAEELANLHKNGIAHGDLNPHNVYIDINNKAIIPKDLNADMSSLTDDTVGFANDCYNMGRIILFIASNGLHEFCDTSSGDINNSKDREDLELIKDEPEAYDITAKLLHHEKGKRPTAAFVYSHFLYWDHQKGRSYFEDACEQLKVIWDDAEAKNRELLNDLESIYTDVFYCTWDKKIHAGLLKNKNEYRRKKGYNEYDCTSMCEFLLFIRNVCGHYPEIPGLIKKSVGGDRDQFVTYIRSRYPKLLTEVYKVFDKYNWEETILHQYHRKS